MAQSLIAANNVEKGWVEEVIPDIIDVYINVGFSLYPINADSVADNSAKESTKTQGYNAFVNTLDSMVLHTAFIKNCINTNKENSVIHKEFFVDCSDLLLDEQGYCADAYTAYLKILEALMMVDRCLSQYYIRHEKVFAHINVYSFENLEDLAWGFAFMSDAMMSLNVYDKELENIILDDYSPYFIEYINQGWKTSVEYVGLFSATRVFFLGIQNNQMVSSQPSHSLLSPSSRPPSSAKQSPIPVEDDWVEKDPFFAMMHPYFGYGGIPTIKGYGSLEETPSNPKVLDGYVAINVGEKNGVQNSGNEVLDIDEKSYGKQDKKQTNPNDAVTTEADTHPFLWFMYTGIKPILFLTHEGLKSSHFSDAMDAYFLSIYFSSKGDEKKSRTYIKKGNKELSEFIHSTLEVASWFPIIGTAASVMDGIYYAGQVWHSCLTGDVQSGIEYDHEFAWALIGAIPFAKLVRARRVEKTAEHLKNSQKVMKTASEDVTKAKGKAHGARNKRRVEEYGKQIGADGKYYDKAKHAETNAIHNLKKTYEKYKKMKQNNHRATIDYSNATDGYAHKTARDLLDQNRNFLNDVLDYIMEKGAYIDRNANDSVKNYAEHGMKEVFHRVADTFVNYYDLSQRP